MLLVDNIDVYYGIMQILWKVTLAVKNEEFVTVIGPNGAGKTTLLKAISGLLTPTSGAILFEGKRINGLFPNTIVDLGISMVPEGKKIWPRMTVLENLELGAYTQRARKKMKENLDFVFGLFPVLRERKKQLAGSLSGGEQQMLAIGRALMTDPKLLLLDEPSLGLAPVLYEKILETLKRINKEQGISVLLVEQNVYLGLEYADRAYVLENGKIIMEGPGKILLHHDHIKKAYLGV